MRAIQTPEAAVLAALSPVSPGACRPGAFPRLAAADALDLMPVKPAPRALRVGQALGATPQLVAAARAAVAVAAYPR